MAYLAMTRLREPAVLTELSNLDVDAFTGSGRVQKVGGRGDMTSDELPDALGGPVADVADLRCETRRNLYSVANDQGEGGDPKDMRKRALIEALSGTP